MSNAATFRVFEALVIMVIVRVRVIVGDELGLVHVHAVEAEPVVVSVDMLGTLQK